MNRKLSQIAFAIENNVDTANLSYGYREIALQFNGDVCTEVNTKCPRTRLVVK